MPVVDVNVFCRAPECPTKLGKKYLFYCMEHREVLVEHLIRSVNEIMRDASKVYIGRSAHPERRLLEHHANEGRDHMAVLHWAADYAEAERTESLVIDEYLGRKLKLENDTAESFGRHSGPWSCVYASWTWKASARPDTARYAPVRGLDWRRRLHPDPTVPKVVNYLRADMTRDQARDHLKSWWASLRA